MKIHNMLWSFFVATMLIPSLLFASWDDDGGADESAHVRFEHPDLFEACSLNEEESDRFSDDEESDRLFDEENFDQSSSGSDEQHYPGIHFKVKDEDLEYDKLYFDQSEDGKIRVLRVRIKGECYNDVLMNHRNGQTETSEHTYYFEYGEGGEVELQYVKDLNVTIRVNDVLLEYNAAKRVGSRISENIAQFRKELKQEKKDFKEGKKNMTNSDIENFNIREERLESIDSRGSEEFETVQEKIRVTDNKLEELEDMERLVQETKEKYDKKLQEVNGSAQDATNKGLEELADLERLAKRAKEEYDEKLIEVDKSVRDTTEELKMRNEKWGSQVIDYAKENNLTYNVVGQDEQYEIEKKTTENHEQDHYNQITKYGQEGITASKLPGATDEDNKEIAKTRKKIVIIMEALAQKVSETDEEISKNTAKIALESDEEVEIDGIKFGANVTYADAYEKLKDKDLNSLLEQVLELHKKNLCNAAKNLMIKCNWKTLQFHKGGSGLGSIRMEKEDIFALIEKVYEQEMEIFDSPSVSSSEGAWNLINDYCQKVLPYMERIIEGINDDNRQAAKNHWLNVVERNKEKIAPVMALMAAGGMRGNQQAKLFLLKHAEIVKKLADI